MEWNIIIFVPIDSRNLDNYDGPFFHTHTHVCVPQALKVWI